MNLVKSNDRRKERPLWSKNGSWEALVPMKQTKSWAKATVIVICVTKEVDSKVLK